MMDTSTRTPQEKVCGYEYTVKRGDSFYLIAHRLGVPLRDLLEANADINPARLMVGDVLCIPIEEDDTPAPETQLPAQPPTEPEPPVEESPEDAMPQAPAPERPTPAEDIPEAGTPEETVEEEIIPDIAPEDSLDMPATEPERSESASADACSGMRYVVSEGETAADIQLDTGLSYNTLQTANPGVCLDRLTAGEALCIPAENIPCPMASTYAIQAGETLEAVALKLNASLGALLRANPCLAPADFVEGQCIIVPV